MFTEQLDSTELRQGDIISGMIFPLPRIGEIRLLGAPRNPAASDLQTSTFEPTLTPVGKSPTPWLTAQVHAAMGFCAVLGQCCEVAADQNPPPKTLVLCRLVPVPDGIKKRPELYRTLKENVDPYGMTRAFYALFYVGDHEKLGDELVADFSQAMTLRWVDYDAILGRKILQLDDVNRNKFRVKVGAYFGRPPDEDVEAGLDDPWRTLTEAAPKNETISGRLRRAFRVLRGKE